MHSFTKQLIFVAVGVVIIATGVWVAVVVSNRGAEPYIYMYMKFNEGYGSTAHDNQGNVDGAMIWYSILYKI